MDNNGTSHHHVPTMEAKLAPILRKSPKLATVYETTELNQYVTSDVAVCGILPYLDRLSDFPAFSETCRHWNSLAQIARATSPACARDIRLAVEFGLHHPNKKKTTTPGSASSDEGSTYDGEYKLFHHGTGPTMTLYCHNVLSDQPTEFISLKGEGETNYSYAPRGGSCRGTSVRTKFFKLRFDPWSLTVKTDDYTFTQSSGGPLSQSYWNGARSVTLNQVPYATARASSGGSYRRNTARALVDNLDVAGDPFLPSESGLAMIDLRGTGFSIENADKNDQDSAFCCMGCAPFGRIAVAASSPTPGSCHQLIHLAGGGFAGRLAPRYDRTRDETASSYNFDDEGNNGGWVLPLKMVKGVDEIMEEEMGWVVTASAPVTDMIEQPMRLQTVSDSTMSVTTGGGFSHLKRLRKLTRLWKKK